MIQKSKINPRYFADDTGKTFLPIGMNICFVRDSTSLSEEEILKRLRHWFVSFAENGGNFVRIWLGVPFFNVMPEQAGVLCEENLHHIRTVIQWAEELNIKVKLTLEHFRRIEPVCKDAESFPGAVKFTEPVYAPYARNMKEYCESEACRKFYLQKAAYIAHAAGSSPALIAVELWNEINCISGTEPDEGPVSGYVAEWSRYMITELQKLFPKQMIVQNLGSFSAADGYAMYDYLGNMENNAFMQVHRYLDPGADLEVCKGPMDILGADAVREMRMRRPDLPAIVAETGAVEANHARYSDLYADDTEGTLLHDGIFAPFFAGSAGCGQFWHWDLYVDKYNLWYQFARFAEAVRGIDPAAEAFEPFYTETHRLRIYGLSGRTMDLIWCRDKASSWQSELKEKHPADLICGESIFLKTSGKIDFYLPWENRHVTEKWTGCHGVLPDFRRSIVIRVQKN